ncbi:AAR088Wp [Eremothecium gossypii ATCC 10895]|uniref:Required for respiratory growth protein 8, mitochondrial n=1 Tax=Eremothecium gossypii (strain ATCC 10895 / CBS 109.51 / FGSC 9923 / NRRL Y-1056) TaxID=284811 RepID=RRG8_EREGS|nr:AAR088Wp [Eremothecium gossypii ATCC 10895]Q75EJ1.2 RecName: Full=Required for respiratory growth protein 8, mitochondrial [Eremothecium gossypii ATCC 10895]AAS50453.2 AAR088Wp [Eremothecium gossypii ATCC 10895]AEY94739.1 FAAR088Wp [Eremothecium gossypii FDAG1]
MPRSVPDMSELLVKGVKHVYGRKMRKTRPTLPNVESPLVTHFHRWAGKRIRLSFLAAELGTREGQHILPDWNLRGNLFAGLLAAPMRWDRLGNLRVPKSFLMQTKARALEAPSDGKLVKIISVVEERGPGSSSYVPQSKAALQRAKQAMFVPVALQQSDMRYFSSEEIAVDKDTLLAEYSAQLISKVKEGLEVLLSMSGTSHERVELEDWDVVVTYDPDNANDIELRKCKGIPGDPVVIILNMGCLKCTELEELVNLRLRNHEYGLVLKVLKNERLLKFMYRLITFSR